MVTIGSSFAASMLVEAPFIALEKIILRASVGKPAVPAATNGHAPTPSDSTQPKIITSVRNGITETNQNTRYSNRVTRPEFISNL